MNASGVTLALFGVLVIAQVVSGGALQRLGIMGCPGGSSGSKPTAPPSGGGLPKQPGGGQPPQMPPRFSG